ncbi:MAG TPA: STAS domain-containing protein [Anaerolineae bacterium]
MNNAMLDISRESLKRVELVQVSGRVDSSNAGELDQALKDIMNDGRHNIVLDLSGVNYMSSAGLRALIAALRESKKHRGDVRIATPSERVSEVLSLAGVDSLFQVYDSRAAAVGSF